MRIGCLVAVLMLLAPAALAQTDSRLQALRTGDDLRGFEAVGRLNLAGTGFCTATLIAPDRVLTAAHCLFDSRTGRRLPESQLEFLAGWRTGRAEAIRNVTRVAIWPDFRPGSGAEMSVIAEDIAVLALDRPVRTTGIRPFALAQDVPAAGASVSVVSYGRERAETPSMQESCRVLEQRQSRITILSCAIESGSSGSPVFLREGNELRVAAVISARAEGTASPVSLAVQLGSRVAQLMATLDGGAAGGGARDSARFVRPGGP